MSDKISYSAMAGELRKANRQFEVFKHASEAADVLAGFEKERERLEKMKNQAEQDLSMLQEKCQETYDDEVAIRAKIVEHKKAMDRDEAGAKANAEKIVSKAMVKAEKIVNDANAESNAITQQTKESKIALESCKADEKRAIDSLKKLEDKAAKFKASLMKV